MAPTGDRAGGKGVGRRNKLPALFLILVLLSALTLVNNNTLHGKIKIHESSTDSLHRREHGDGDAGRVLATPYAPAIAATEDGAAEKRKKFVVIHIGPSKTGTSTIQYESGRDPKFRQALQKDGAIFVGRLAATLDRKYFLKSMGCAIRLIEGKTRCDVESDCAGYKGCPAAYRGCKCVNGACRRAFKDCKTFGKGSTNRWICPRGQECVVRKDPAAVPKKWGECKPANSTQAPSNSDALSSMQRLIKEKCYGGEGRRYIESNIIMSDEGYSYSKSFGEDSEIRISQIHRIYIDYFNFDEIIVVAAYRRYWQWAASTYREQVAQSCLHRGMSSCRNIWHNYTKPGVDSEHFGFRNYRNIDETMLSRMEPGEGWWSAAAIHSETARWANIPQNRNRESKAKFDILNYFQLPSERYYNSITTELYCKSLGANRTPHTCRHSRDGRGDEGAGVFNKKHGDEVGYHEIFMEAQRRGWIRYADADATQLAVAGRDADPRVVAERQRWKAELRTSHGNLTGYLPLRCPSRSELQSLLDKSLRLEALMLPGFFSTKLGKEEHVRQFWTAMEEEKPYCWVDIPRLFRNASSWEDLLATRLTTDMSVRPFQIKDESSKQHPSVAAM